MRVTLVTLFLFILGGGMSPHLWRVLHHQDPPVDHTPWVAEVLKQIETIKPGMTRKQLESVFTTEGGISTVLQRTYVTRACPYFKVDVQFRIVGRPERDQDGRITVEDGSDLIARISRPYLQRPVYD